jgi:phosphatidate cytidylyltransferase
VKELTKRISVAIWGIPLLLILSYLGGYYFLGLIIVINGMTLFEFFSIYEKKQIYAYRWLAILSGTVFLILIFHNLLLEVTLVNSFGIILILLFLLRKQKGVATSNMAFTVAGLLYISGFLAAMLYLRSHFNEFIPNQVDGVAYAGGRFLIILWISIWICDTAAYFGGKTLGKHKLAPIISPNKTIEGGIFGLLFGIFTFVLLGMVLLPQLKAEYLWISGAIVGLFGQLGDLVESRFKRDVGVKDTSAILPGHGGFLDRFDSFIFVSPFLLGLYSLIKF